MVANKENITVQYLHVCPADNFLGTSLELRKAFNVMNHTKINNFLMELGGEWITWRQILPPNKQHGWGLGAPNLFSSKYTQLIEQ